MTYKDLNRPIADMQDGRSKYDKIRLYVSGLFFLPILILLGLCLATGNAAAIPNVPPQSACRTSQIFNSDTSDPTLVDLRVRVNNGNRNPRCVVQFNAEAATEDQADSMLLTFAIGTPADLPTAEDCSLSTSTNSRFFTFPHAIRFDTVTSIAIIRPGTGIRIIQPCFQPFDNDDDGAQIGIGNRCLTVECQTR